MVLPVSVTSLADCQFRLRPNSFGGEIPSALNQSKEKKDRERALVGKRKLSAQNELIWIKIA